MASLMSWLSTLPLAVIGGMMFVGMGGAALAGTMFRARSNRGAAGEQLDGEGYLVSAVLGLLALLMGFTLTLAVDRFETRRTLVLEEANAIGTAYLRAQLLDPPHRRRISDLLLTYLDGRVALSAAPPEQALERVARSDAILTELWAATAAAFVTIRGIDFSSTFVDSMNRVIEVDAARKAARYARVPDEVFGMLTFFLFVTSFLLGYVLVGRRGRIAAVLAIGLLASCFLLILDIDRPGRGGVRESQKSIEWLRDSLKSQPTRVYDQYLEAPAPGVR